MEEGGGGLEQAAREGGITRLLKGKRLSLMIPVGLREGWQEPYLFYGHKERHDQGVTKVRVTPSSRWVILTDIRTPGRLWAAAGVWAYVGGCVCALAG